MMDLKSQIANVPDFPQPGILYRDIMPLLRRHFDAALDAMERLFDDAEWRSIDALAGIESRGFILAAGLAARRAKGFVPIRKQGKLPPPVVSAAYSLEYGSAVLEVQSGDGRIALIDDVLATGGTMRAATELAALAGYQVVALAALIDLCLAKDFACQGLPLRSVIRYG